jgi:hypothetical protein
MDALDAVQTIRSKRRGAINAKQVFFFVCPLLKKAYARA